LDENYKYDVTDITVRQARCHSMSIDSTPSLSFYKVYFGAAQQLRKPLNSGGKLSW